MPRSVARHARSRVLAVAAGLALLVLAGTARAGDKLPEPVAKWMEYEQAYLDRSLNTNRITSPKQNAQKQEFKPETGATFKVKSYWIDVDDANAFVGQTIQPWLKNKLVRTDRGRTRVRFIVHPESEALYADALKGAARAPDLNATATASSRSLLVWDAGDAERPFFAKTSLDVDIGGLRRNIPFKETLRSVGYSDTLEADRASLPENVRFLPEVFAAIPRGMETGGMVIREVPEDIASGKTRLMPLFSLYAEPPDGSDPLLARMIKKSGQKPDEFVRQRLVRPFAKIWFRLVLEQGATISPHAQNVLLEIGKDGMPTGNWIIRDLGDIAIDHKYRKQIGRRNPRRLPRIAERYDIDYRTGNKVKSRFDNAHTYFAEGFLFNLDDRLPKWAKSGLIDAVPTQEEWDGNSYFRSMLDTELAGAFREMTGMKVASIDEYDVEAMTDSGRDILLQRARKAGVRPGKARRRPAGSPSKLRNGLRALQQRQSRRDRVERARASAYERHMNRRAQQGPRGRAKPRRGAR